MLGELSRSRPIALTVMAAFLWSMSPRSATAADSQVPESARRTGIAQGLHDLARSRSVSEPKLEASEVLGSVGLREPGIKLPANGAAAGAGSLRSLPTGEVNKSGVTAQSIVLPDGPATISGMGESFSAQPSTGLASFALPFALPRARGGVQPALGLGYSSSSGAGNAGVGWSVGLPAIARQTDRGLPMYDDQSAWHARQDRFIFNGGQELVPICTVSQGSCPGAIDGEVMPSWGDGWQYFRPRVEGGYARFFWNPTARLWRVQGKDGTLLELGAVDGESDALETDPNDPNRVFQWNLKRQVDAFGNQVVYQYETREGEAFAVLTDIFATPPLAASAPDPSRSAWAHHVRLRYEDRKDPSTNFRRGWRSVQARKLIGVDVTARGDQGQRELIRRYHLRYHPYLHTSLLEGVKQEGRCSPPIFEAMDGSVPDDTACPTLPEMTFEYTHVADSFPNGFEDLSAAVTSLANSPDHSLDEDWTDLYDVNSDGLPDVVTMMPALYGGQHALWLNGKGGLKNGFGALEKMGLSTTEPGANTTVITKKNPNVVFLDLDGNGSINLLHMPKAKTWYSYEPRFENSKWAWASSSAITSADGQDARISFSADAENIRVVDVNGDGLVDVLKSAGTSLVTWFALGRWEGGYGRFGHVEWSGGVPTLSMEPVERCVPWAGQAQQFTNGDVSLADMNGDGLADLVRLRQGDIKYWPGRGDGSFGTGPLACAGGTFSEDSHVAMSDSPFYTDPGGTALRLDDVNGDGLADLVHVRFKEVDVWLNIDGAKWTQRRTLAGAPISAAHTARVRLADMNGSGTADIVWGDGGAYKYMDLSGGQRPWLLARVHNGLGKTTEIEYTTTTALMLQAASEGNPWTSLSPGVTHVVSRVRVLDGLDQVGWPQPTPETTYLYRDPVYDGIQREFRGFRQTQVTVAGDIPALDSVTQSEFHLGERPHSFPIGPVVDYRDPREAWRANPMEAMKGLPSLTETRAASPQVYLSGSVVSYELRRLYGGLDGRDVYAVVATGEDSVTYDTSMPATPADPIGIDAGFVIANREQSVKTTGAQLPVKGAVAGMRHVASRITTDLFGNRTSSTALGIVGVDEPIVSHSIPARWPTPQQFLGDGGWSWRTITSWVDGSNGHHRRQTQATYGDKGELLKTEVQLEDVGVLTRSPTGAPPPQTVSTGGMIATSRLVYDGVGNLVFAAGAGGRCREMSFDQVYGLFPERETIFAGTAGLTFPVGPEEEAVCGTRRIETNGEWDKSIQAVKNATGPNGERSRVERDAFGRLIMAFRPDPDQPGATSSLPHRIIEYATPEVTGVSLSRIHTRDLDGANDSDAQYHESYAFVDGLGRTAITFSEADPDPALGDGFAWVVSGLASYDRKGAVLRKYLPWASDSAPESLAVILPPQELRYGEMLYDPFGRPIQAVGLDGKPTSRTRYHAGSVDRWDAEDIGPGPHESTYATEESDGHGRVIRVTERVRIAGKIEERHVRSRYLQTGEVVELRRERGTDHVTRTMAYDTLGRMVLNEVPNAGTWRYAYSDAGELVGTSDPRGCGVNFAYDSAGRLLSEDYSPCEAHHEPYDPALDVEYRYDDPDPDAPEAFNGAAQQWTIARLTSVRDRSSKALTRHDLLGRPREVAKRVASPTGSLDGSQWFRRTVEIDGAGRPVVETTGASLNLGPGQRSAVLTTYTRSGAARQVDSDYGLLIHHVKRSAEGLTEEIQYGDGASTTTAFLYDDLRRIHGATTFRAKQPDWVAPGTPGDARYSQQMLLQDEEINYDRVGNPIEIRDWRTSDEWPAGAKPVTRKMKYDDLYRVVQVDYQFPDGWDHWVDPFAAEAQPGLSSERPQPAPRRSFAGGRRPMQQKWQYDWLGNTVANTDDANAFYDRSLGEIKNEVYQLKTATGVTGNLSASYDAAGNMQSLTVHRDGACVGSCNDQHFGYEWDEVGRLSAARRWDQVPWEGQAPAAEMHYAYDASDMRVRKTVTLPAGVERHTVYVFGSLELRMASWDDAIGYEVSERTEVPYLMSGGKRVGRVVHTFAPSATDPTTRVFLELGDHLGSNSVVLDRATGELVERRTAYAYGAVESDFRPGRWQEFREDYRFTGKEDDVEVGLTYFGKRYYAPLLGRWMSADPLAIHEPGRADANLYAYAHGRVYAAVDPVGLEILTAMAVGFAIGAAVGAGINAVSQYVSTGEVKGGAVLGAAAEGGLAGLFSGGLGSSGAASALSQGGGWGAAQVGQSALTVNAASFSQVTLAAAPSATAVGMGAFAASAYLTVPVGAAIGVGAAGASGKGSAADTFKWGMRGAEAGLLASAGAALGYGTGAAAGFGSALKGSMAASAAINGGFTGARGVYDWGSLSGPIAFGSDSTWGITGTTLGNLMNIGNTIGGADYNNELSERQNRQVFNDGFHIKERFAHTQGNVISNLNTNKGSHSQELLDHESFHITENRVFGTSYLYTYAMWLVYGGIAGGVLAGDAQKYGYYNNPWEAWARWEDGRLLNGVSGW